MLAPWRVLALVGAGVAALLLLCAVLLLPETPNHLVAKGKTTAARRVLARLRSSATEADDEFEALMRKHQAGASVADADASRTTTRWRTRSERPPRSGRAACARSSRRACAARSSSAAC